MQKNSLLLDLGVPFRREGDKLLVESQALNGMRLWAEHFEHVTVCAPELPRAMADQSSVVWADPSGLLSTGRLSLEPQPWGYHPREHFRRRSQVRERLAGLVADHRYLCFSNLGVFGGWGSIAAQEARRQGRKHALWFDWVLHAMAGPAPGDAVGRRVWKRWVQWLTWLETRKAIGACDLGLFHGKSVFDAYSPWCRESHVVHDIHVSPRDVTDEAALAEKLTRQGQGSALHVGYVGRMHPMKAPLQWIDAVAAAVRELPPGRLRATWYGDGPLLDAAHDRVRALNLEAVISLPGFISDRQEVLQRLRALDAMVFCHLTPESPRCLPEALISGTPLVGYDSPYARELVEGRGGARLVDVGDVAALSACIVSLARSPASLVQLTREAATARDIFTDEAVFAHRSELIKRFL